MKQQQFHKILIVRNKFNKIKHDLYTVHCIVTEEDEHILTFICTCTYNTDSCSL